MSAERVTAQLVHEPDHLFDALTRLSLRLRMLLFLVAWACSVLAATVVTPTSAVRVGATVLHVLSLVIAFGAVVVVDWHGVLWLLGRRGLHECTRLAGAVDPLIWIGLAGLLLSGALLRPNLESPVTWTKLFLVLALGINGVMTSTTAQLLRDLPRSIIPASLPRRLRTQVLVASAVSQVGWWGAITIGFVTAIRSS